MSYDTTSPENPGKRLKFSRSPLTNFVQSGFVPSHASGHWGLQPVTQVEINSNQTPVLNTSEAVDSTHLKMANVGQHFQIAGNTDDKLNQILSHLSAMNTNAQVLHKDLKSDLEQINSNMGTLTKRMDTVEYTMQKLNYTCLDIDARSRQSNLLIHGITETHGEDLVDVVCKFVSDDLEIRDAIAIQSANRLGRIPPGRAQTATRPILCKMTYDHERDQIVSRARLKLTHSNKRVSRDYPVAIRNARKHLGVKYRQYQATGQNVRFGFPAKLIVDGRVTDDQFPDWYKILRGDNGQTETSSSRDTPNRNPTATTSTTHIAGTH